MKRPVVVAIALGLSVIMSLIFMMYAFVQKAEAEKQFMRAEQCARERNESRFEVEKTRYDSTQVLKLLEEKTKAETK